MDPGVWMERMVLLVSQVSLEKWVLEDFLDQEDSMDCLDLLAYLDLKALLDQRVMKVLRDHLDLLVRLETRDQWDLMDLLDHWDHLVKQDQEASLDCLVCQELMVCLGKMEALASLAQRETKD